MNTKKMNPAGIKKSDFVIEGDRITLKEGTWDKRVGDRITEEQAQAYLEVEEDFSTSVLSTAGKLALGVMEDNDEISIVDYNAELPGGAEINGKIYKERSFGSDKSKSKKVYPGYSTMNVSRNLDVDHVQDHLSEMARKKFG